MNNYRMTYQQIRGDKIGRGGFEMHENIDTLSIRMQKLFNARTFEAKAFDGEGNTVARVWVMDNKQCNWFCESEVTA